MGAYIRVDDRQKEQNKLMHMVAKPDTNYLAAESLRDEANRGSWSRVVIQQMKVSHQLDKFHDDGNEKLDRLLQSINNVQSLLLGTNDENALLYESKTAAIVSVEPTLVNSVLVGGNRKDIVVDDIGKGKMCEAFEAVVDRKGKGIMIDDQSKGQIVSGYVDGSLLVEIESSFAEGESTLVDDEAMPPILDEEAAEFCAEENSVDEKSMLLETEAILTAGKPVLVDKHSTLFVAEVSVEPSIDDSMLGDIESDLKEDILVLVDKKSTPLLADFAKVEGDDSVLLSMENYEYLGLVICSAERRADWLPLGFLHPILMTENMHGWLRLAQLSYWVSKQEIEVLHDQSMPFDRGKSVVVVNTRGQRGGCLCDTVEAYGQFHGRDMQHIFGFSRLSFAAGFASSAQIIEADVPSTTHRGISKLQILSQGPLIAKLMDVKQAENYTGSNIGNLHTVGWASYWKKVTTATVDIFKKLEEWSRSQLKKSSYPNLGIPTTINFIANSRASMEGYISSKCAEYLPLHPRGRECTRAGGIVMKLPQLSFDITLWAGLVRSGVG